MQLESATPWSTLRTHLSTQVRVTTGMVNDKAQMIQIRHTPEPEPTHVEIDKAVGLACCPTKTPLSVDRKFVVKNQKPHCNDNNSLRNKGTNLG